MSSPVIVVVGAGPGMGGAMARRFGREGYDAVLIGIEEQVLADLTANLAAEGVSAEWRIAEVTDADDLTDAIRECGERTGRIDVLHFNPSAYRAKDPLQLSVEELLADVSLGVGALLTSVQAARPFMSSGGRVTVTGSMAADRPSHAAASLGVQKAGVQNLVRSIDATLAPEGIRAVSVTVRGALSREGAFTPDRVADAIYAAATQPEEDWRAEVPYSG